MLLKMDDGLFKRSLLDMVMIFTGGAINIVLWVTDTLMQSLGFNFVVASMLAYIFFIQVAVISSITLMVPLKKFPVETGLFYFCLVIFVWSGEADFLWKQETTEKKPITTEKKPITTQIQPSDPKRNSFLENLRQLFRKETEALIRSPVDMASRYYYLLNDHTCLIGRYRALIQQNSYLRDKIRILGESMNPEPIPEVKLLCPPASSLGVVRPNPDLLEGGVSDLLCNKKNGTSPSTEAVKVTESSEGEDVKFSEDPDAVKFTVDPEVVKLSTDLESVKSALATEVAKPIVDFETVKSAVDPGAVKFTADSETVKFSADPKGAKFAANAQDVETEDPKECEWEVIDASLHDC